ncbi:Fpg/Nei family DNA glycosylase [Dichotomicrobium thermohalophilum]|uniref:Formamidopyrimidine-DNA glycosylase n=1 Tax=Dichotomicrobium thermohalophilum TaxID=933063 RepID=A0A397PCU3_9HYPH|nr:DNA-formamidopyrimidine glycosylase family protein [Dichotomicrobium thermohalophilum]RIA47350.1 formamidopyrimidine-DNA glycosylase [Dichotomicrobium thermohalophilum]
MPELPDVENFKRYLDATGLHKRIEHITLTSEKVLHGVTRQKLAAALTGHALSRTYRHGKHLFAELDDGPWLMLHFGMTGFLAYFQNLDDDPEHDRLRLDFDNGYHLAFVNQRLFGEVGVVEDPAAFITEQELGPDALALDEDAFRHVLAERRGQVKSALMDQSLIAGIGNVYSDEMLFQAGIHPKTLISDLDDAAVHTLYAAMMNVLNVAIDKGAGSADLFDNLPQGWLLPHRDEGAKCPRCGGAIEKVSAAGRGAYICPQCQPEP